MNSLMFLKAAYAISWVVYLGYLARILLRMKKVQQEHQEFDRVTAASAPPPAALKRSAG